MESEGTAEGSQPSVDSLIDLTDPCNKGNENSDVLNINISKLNLVNICNYTAEI